MTQREEIMGLVVVGDEYMNTYNATEQAYRNGYEAGVREFAERLKKKTYPFPCAIGVENAVTIRAINDLLKELTERKEDEGK
jgi:hypothetical protein